MAAEAPADLAEEGKRAYQAGQYEEAARLFRRAAEDCKQQGADLLAAEINNNLSVTLLQAGKPQQALEAVRGTDQVFAAASDFKRQAMALGNQAASLEALHRPDEALETYARSEELFARLDEGEMLALVKKSMAAIHLKRGHVRGAAMKMMGSVEAKSRPTFLERILKFILRFKPW